LQATYALIPEERQFELKTETLESSSLSANSILIEAEASAVSPGTELAIFTASIPGIRQPGRWSSYPCRPGYSCVGRVLEKGAEVEQVAVGDRVFTYGHHASHQIYEMADRKAAYVIPDDLSFVNASMLRLGIISQSAPAVTEIKMGDTVAIFGLGVIGNIAAQLYRMLGARVIGFDPIPQRCELAQKVGIEQAFSVPAAEQVTIVKALTDGKGAEITVDAVGHGAVIQNCVQATASKGQIILLGSPRAPYEGNITQAFRDIHLRWLTMRGALDLPLPPYPTFGVDQSIQDVIDTLVKAINQGHLDLDSLISHVIAPKELGTAYTGLLDQKDSYSGVVVDWSQLNR